MQTTTATSWDHQHGNADDAEYTAFLARVQARFTANIQGGKQPLFRTSSAGLWDAYLATFTDPVERQHHNCNACRQFIDRFGGLVTISEDGVIQPAVWNADDAPTLYRPAVEQLVRLVRTATVTGVFIPDEQRLGTPKTGRWTHLAVTVPKAMVHSSRTKTAGQVEAEKREEFGMLRRGVAEWKPDAVDQAVSLLRRGALARSEKVLGPAEFLQDLQRKTGSALRTDRRDAMIWRAVATAPAGFAHVRGGMLGSLLEDIAEGMAFDDIKARFDAKMDPLQYQRPQAAPTAGAIAQAEKLIEQLGAAGALSRRYARLDEVQAVWKPRAQKAEQTTGVFGHLKPKAAAVLKKPMGPASKMTWAKFSRDVLPAADRIEVRAPALGGYTSLLTAADPFAPPIIQWDSEERRNPVSWYFWTGGGTATQFGLEAGCFYPVTAITLKPSMWHGGFEHHGTGALFIIEGAADSRRPGLCLFPEMLRSELHGVRSVLEAYSRDKHPEGHDQQGAAGIMLAAGDNTGAMSIIRVWTGSTPADYQLDRWD